MMELQRNLEKGGLKILEDTLIDYFSPQTPAQNTIWSDKQAYIGLGTALIAGGRT